MRDPAELAAEAVRLFDTGLACSEAVVLAGMPWFEIDSPLVPRIATGFGGGVSRTGSLCGALAGGVLVLGAAFGRDVVTDDRKRILAETQALVGGFRQRFGSDNCFALTGLDFNEPGAMDAYRARVHGECRAFVRYVAEHLAAAAERAAIG